MNFNFDNIYLNEVSTVAGVYESNGPLGKMFDKTYKDFYFGKKTFEDAESKLILESMEILLKKLNKNTTDLVISGDLQNQIAATDYALSNLNIPLIGVYAACATSTLSLILGSILIKSKKINNCICSTSSHNTAAEKQFRYPVEYGGPKKSTQTFTTTGGVSAYLSSNKSSIKITGGTIGKVIDMGITDVNNMGAVMAPAAADTLYNYLKYNNKSVDDFDIILTGDLGIIGKKIFKEYLKKEYKIDIKNYNDCGTIIYDIDKQDVYSGGSGPACLPLVAYTYVYNKLKNKEYKKVLLIATGALHSLSRVNEKYSIPSIAHLISLEAQ